VGIFVAFQLFLFFGLLFSSVVRWTCALIIISYVVISAFKGYDHLELTLHGPHTLHNQVAPTVESLGTSRRGGRLGDGDASGPEEPLKSKSD
jgi:hypothetical protein